LGDFSKIKIGTILQLFLIFSFSIVSRLELSFVDEWNNRYKSIKIFLNISTMELENKGQGRDIPWFGLLTERSLAY
jgi:hypothetical protein